MKAFVLSGQRSQLVGMGEELCDSNETARGLFDKASEVLGYCITDIMFDGAGEQLKETKVTQPTVFLHNVTSTLCMSDAFKPDVVAGHSLGEFSALVAAGALSFKDGLKLIYARAVTIQKVCKVAPGTMTAIIGLPDEEVEEICQEVSREDKVVIPTNYNYPGQLVTSGDREDIEEACKKLEAAGIKRALPLKAGGAFHSPLTQLTKDELQKAIEATTVNTPQCPVYQNVDGKPYIDTAKIKVNFITQPTNSIRQTTTVQNMIADGATGLIKCGPGKALQGMMGRISKEATVHGI